MKIALVHDFLREYGGAERVVETSPELHLLRAGGFQPRAREEREFGAS